MSCHAMFGKMSDLGLGAGRDMRGTALRQMPLQLSQSLAGGIFCSSLMTVSLNVFEWCLSSLEIIRRVMAVSGVR